MVRKSFDQFFDAGALFIKRREHFQRFAWSDLVLQSGGLQDGTNALPYRAGIGDRIDAADRNGAGIRLA